MLGEAAQVLQHSKADTGVGMLEFVGIQYDSLDFDESYILATEQKM